VAGKSDIHLPLEYAAVMAILWAGGIYTHYSKTDPGSARRSSGSQGTDLGRAGLELSSAGFSLRGLTLQGLNPQAEARATFTPLNLRFSVPRA